MAGRTRALLGLLLAARAVGFRLPGNVVFHKVPKCASSTFGGVLRRICSKHGMEGCLGEGATNAAHVRQGAANAAHTRALLATHRPLGSFRLWNVSYPRAFRVTMLREPASRALSEYYHQTVSRAQRPPSTSMKLRQGELSPPTHNHTTPAPRPPAAPPAWQSVPQYVTQYVK
mmetsp:Transcript_41416/g.102170  ORF Transcript_41416/g.102170 Transcript_41416/m.102170 type:complete len:173 (+) Transcript_41416:166-684(+)